MVDSGKRSNIILWTGLAAAAAGIVAVAVIARWKDHVVTRAHANSHLRDVQDVLTDCYDKIREIEKRLPSSGARSDLDHALRSVSRSISDGHPALET